MKFKFLTVLIVFIFVSMILLQGCSTVEIGSVVSQDSVAPDVPPEKSAYPVSFDNESFDSSPQTVVSLSPALTDILCELGLESRIIGVSDYCSVSGFSVERVGSPAFPDIERIAELAPELLITQSPLASADIIKLKQAGVRTLYLPLPKDFSYLCQEYIHISMIFFGAVDSRDIAFSALSYIDGAMTSAEAKGFSLNFIAVSGEDGGLYSVIVGESLADDMLSVFGTNLLKESEKRLLTADELKKYQPDIIIVSEDVDGRSLSDIFDKRPSVVSCDLADFERPTAGLGEIIYYISAELG